MPRPDDPGIDGLLRGQYDSRWVEATGVVQSVAQDHTHAILDIVEGTHRFRAHFLAPASTLVDLIDARVRVRGAYYGLAGPLDPPVCGGIAGLAARAYI